MTSLEPLWLPCGSVRPPALEPARCPFMALP